MPSYDVLYRVPIRPRIVKERPFLDFPEPERLSLDGIDNMRRYYRRRYLGSEVSEEALSTCPTPLLVRT